MRVPVGQLLIRQRLITPEQLEAALRAQGTWSHRLGSRLVQLGYLENDVLARVLSTHFGVPAAYDADFQAIKPSALSRLPRRLVEKHLAVPLALHHTQATRSLAVALADPTAVGVIDELAFAAGMRVEVNVAPELRILRFLEEGELSRSEVGLWTPAPAPAPLPELAPFGTPIPTPRGVWIGEEEGASPGASAPPPQDRIAAAWQAVVKAAASPQPDDLMAMVLEGLTLTEAQAQGWLNAPPPELPSELSATHAIGLLGQTRTRDRVGDILLQFLRSHLEFGALLVVGDGLARGWRGFGPRTELAPMNDVSLPLNVASGLRVAYDRRGVFQGPPPREGGPIHARLWRALRSEPPREILVAPLLLGARVAGLAYAHGSEGKTVPAMLAEELERVCAAAATALMRS